MKPLHKKKFSSVVVLAVILFAGCKTALLSPSEKAGKEDIAQSLVQVTVASQGYYFHRPWQQRRPTTQTAIGVVVPGGHVLVTGFLVADHRYIELETVDTRRKHRAEVVVVDYEANLALLKPEDPSFLADRKPLGLTHNVVVGDPLTIWQVRPNGDTIAAIAEVNSVELTPFSMGHFFLAYRLEGALPYGYGHQTLPAIKDGKLAGLVLRASKGQMIDVVAAPVVEHFLQDAAQGRYHGFPLAGFHYGHAIDPQLRDYVGLSETVHGIYVQKVIKGGPADQSGLLAGDIVTHIGDFAVSDTGYYQHPLHGNIPVVHLIRTGYHAGDTMPVKIFRKSRSLDLQIVLDHREPEDYLIPPYILDQAPDYRIVGGFVLQELSLSYLREYGNNWSSSAPAHLLFYNQNQDYLNGDGREKIVIISNVIPTPFTIGFENLSNLVVTRVNGKEIGELADVDNALAAPVNGFHKIEVEQSPRVIYLDPAQLPTIHRLIEERYRIPTKADQ